MNNITNITEKQSKELLKYIKNKKEVLKKDLETGRVSYEAMKIRSNKPVDIVANIIRSSYKEKEQWWQAHYLLYVVPKKNLPLYVNTEWSCIAQWRLKNGI